MQEYFVQKAGYDDLQEILDLQYLAYQSEAELFGTRDIPPLKQTLEEVISEIREGIILKIVDNGKIIASVRAALKGETVYIGKLMVHPNYRCMGLGTSLLSEVEKVFPNKRYELFTSTRSKNNIGMYQRLGYRPFKEKKINEELTFVFLEKFQKTS
ncbi:MAG: GNAT family N-acetyltransferase [Oscillospiraceae bacterium]